MHAFVRRTDRRTELSEYRVGIPYSAVKTRKSCMNGLILSLLGVWAKVPWITTALNL